MSLPSTTANQPDLLQSGERLDTADHYLPSTPQNVLWGRLPGRNDAPRVRARPGERVVIDTVSHEGIMDDQGGDPVAFFREIGGVLPDRVLTDAIAITQELRRAPEDGPHIVTGPVAVAGAQPGDLLAVTIERLQPRAPYGVISTRHGRGVLHGDQLVDGAYSAFTEVVEADGIRSGRMALREGATAGPYAAFPLAPFLGIIGVAADLPERPHSTPPGLHGGNLDIALLTEGSTLYLPVQVPDALLYVGDPHFAQGDGEVALTALEAPLRATLRVDVVPKSELAALKNVTGPFAVAGGALIATGLSENLELALRRAVRNAIGLLTSIVDIDDRRAYLYLSAATDFAVSQAVDIVKGVHGAIRLADFQDFTDGPFTDRVLAAAARSLESA